MDALYLFLILLFAGLLLGFVAACARLAPPAPKSSANKTASQSREGA